MSIPNGTLYQVDSAMMQLYGKEADLFNLLLAVWQRKLNGNIRNEAYYHGRVKPVTSNADMPTELQNLDVVIGWGGKCVDALAARSVLDSFTSNGTASQDLLNALGENDITELYNCAVTSELTDSCAFLTVSAGMKGEPDVIVSARSALDAVAIWDDRKKRIKAGLAVLDIEEDANGYRKPSYCVMYTDDMTYEMRRSGEKWYTTRLYNTFGRPLIEPLRYRPSLTRPFGRSRINRTVRSLINRAMCVAARTETSATFYTWPLRYMLNVDKKTAEAASKRKIEMYTDSWIFASTNKNGDSPQIGQLSQMTMEPHIQHLEMLAKQFASEASIPLDEVGIVFDNPSSAEAMESAQQRLIIEAENVNRSNGKALYNIAQMALASLRGAQSLDELSEDDKSIRAVFKDPLRSSRAARADYAIKVCSVVPSYANTAHFWRDLGYSEQESRQIMSDIRYQQAATLAAQAAAQAVNSGNDSGLQQQANADTAAG